ATSTVFINLDISRLATKGYAILPGVLFRDCDESRVGSCCAFDNWRTLKRRNCSAFTPSFSVSTFITNPPALSDVFNCIQRNEHCRHLTDVGVADEVPVVTRFPDVLNHVVRV